MKRDQKIIEAIIGEMMTIQKSFLLAAATILLFSGAGALRADTVLAKEDKVVIQTYVGQKREVRGYLSKGERAEVFNKTTYTAVMDGAEGPWYFIQTSTGLSGWVFGGNLVFETSAYDFKLVDIQQISDGSRDVVYPAISPDKSLVAYAEVVPDSTVYEIFVHDTKIKKSRSLLSTRYLVGENFNGLGWKRDNILSINTNSGQDRSYQIEFPLDGTSGLPVKEHSFWRSGPSAETIGNLKAMFKDVPAALKDLSGSPREIAERVSFFYSGEKMAALYLPGDAQGRGYIPEIRVLNLKDNKVSSVPFYVSRASAPWEGLLDKPNFVMMGSHLLIYYPNGSDGNYSVDRVLVNSVERLFDISGQTVYFAGTNRRDDILYVYTKLSVHISPSIKLYKYSAGKPLKLVVPKSESWSSVAFSPDGSRIVYSRIIKGKEVLFTATVKED